MPSLNNNSDMEFQRYIGEITGELDVVRQNRLLDESAFLRFLKDRGIEAFGITTGDPSKLHQIGWLTADGEDNNGTPLFHPFRLYVVHNVLQQCKLNIAPSATINRQGLTKFLERISTDFLPPPETIGAKAKIWNYIIDLSVLLEPLYWPIVTNRVSKYGFINESEYKNALDRYRKKIFELVKTLDATAWERHHEKLRTDASFIDENHSLYLLLRSSSWSRRGKLTGDISSALWIRQIAEIIRRAFEDVHDTLWLEEDHAFGQWMQGARTLMYGSERPLDNVSESRPRLAFHFGLSTGSSVRWYVEGDTEYHAILTVIPRPANLGIELVNLRGNLSTERDNIALKLRDCLTEDRALRRFSIISFDTDVLINCKTVRRQIIDNAVVGHIAPHDPDFEFANFTLDELVDIAASLDESNDLSATAIRTANWGDVCTGRAFERRYLTLSERRPRSLKGAEWGKALAEYARKNPNRGDNQTERPFWLAIRAAIQSRTANYDYQSSHYYFDADNFSVVRRT